MFTFSRFFKRKCFCLHFLRAFLRNMKYGRTATSTRRLMFPLRLPLRLLPRKFPNELIEHLVIILLSEANGRYIFKYHAPLHSYLIFPFTICCIHFTIHHMWLNTLLLFYIKIPPCRMISRDHREITQRLHSIHEMSLFKFARWTLGRNKTGRQKLLLMKAKTSEQVSWLHQ